MILKLKCIDNNYLFAYVYLTRINQINYYIHYIFFLVFVFKIWFSLFNLLKIETAALFLNIFNTILVKTSLV